MAMLGLLELMASQGASVDEMFQAAKYANAYWYPQQSLELATYFKAAQKAENALTDAGLTEEQAREQGYAVQASTLPMSFVPRALVARDTRGLVKLVADANTERLLGAHILAPEAGEMIQTAVLAIRFGITLTQLRETKFPYLTNVEGLKLAALAFEKEIAMLSCCAG